jgi:type I restriction enzyme, S subunit
VTHCSRSLAERNEKLATKNTGRHCHGANGPISTRRNLQLGWCWLAILSGQSRIRRRKSDEVKWCSHPSRIAEAGDILLSVRAPVGPTNFATERCCIGRGLAAIRGKSKECNQRYIRYYLKRFEVDIAAHGVGSTFTAINRHDIERLELPVPPVEEQERIVTLLDEADELRKLRAQADGRTAALIPALFNEMFGENQNWPTETLEKLCQRVTVGHVGLMATEYCETGIPFLRGQNIKRGFIELSMVLFVSEAFHRRLEKSAITPGDVVSVRTGKPGTTAVVPPSLGVANCADLIVMTCGPRLSPVFLCELLNQRLGDQDKIAGATGIAQQHFNIGEARRLIIAIPPLPLQKEFAQRVAEIREMESGQAASRRRLGNLFQSMLHRAFAGEM